MHISLTDKGLAQELNSNLKWDQLPSIPDAVGYAGSFAGVSNGTLLVAGGANFPDGGAPWTGSVKKWHNQIFALESQATEWKVVGKLPVPLGYGVSVTWGNALLCFGGSNESGHHADAFILRYKNGEVITETLPTMPGTIANTCGVVIGDIVYIAGGTKAPDSKESTNIFWSLDLSQKAADRKWAVLPTWPGASRMLSVAGALNGEFYLFSGASLKDGKREYLKDAYKYIPGKGWKRIADLPNPVVAAPSTAYAMGKNHLLIFGGDDGKLAPIAADLKEKHGGFSTDILAYDRISDRWMVSGRIFTDKKVNSELNPNGSVWAPVTTPLVVWNGSIILPGGEVRPATRTSRVLQATPLDN
ncbi:galactose oxidase [Flavihumibacter sp. R14]|nr:galactose oxidase [Flavihumibacter soli]